MALVAETDNDIPESVTVITTRREYGFYCWGLIVTLALLLLLIIVSVILLLTTKSTVLVVSVFITVLLIVAAVAFIFIEWQRRQAIKTRDRGTKEWVASASSQSQSKQSSAPSQTAQSSSWMFWRKSSTENGNNVMAPIPTAPPHSARSSWTLSRQSYLPVYVAENKGH